MWCYLDQILLSLSYLFFFFFKQKTAYEMRISDWSSDVCSSDLEGAHHHRGGQRQGWGRQIDPRRQSCRRAASPRGEGRTRRRRHLRPLAAEIGRASCRERVCQYV